MTTKKKKHPKQKKKPRPKHTTNRTNVLIAIVLAVLAFGIYANTLGHGYVLDDYSAIKDNYVTKQGVEGIATIWQEHYRYGFWNSAPALYRPLPLTIFALVWEVSPDNTFLYHLLNVLFFAFTIGLLFVVLRKLLPKTNILLPLAVTLLFAVHPIHVEVVANIKSLDEILAFFFCLKATYLLWRYLERRQVFWWLASVMVYGMALFSKESSITFVAVFPLLLYFFTQEKPVSIAKTAMPYLIPAAVYLYLRHQIVGSVTEGGGSSFLDNAIMASDSVAQQWAMTFLFLGKYLVNLLAPYRLGSDFGYNQIPAISWADWRPIVALLIYGAMGLYAVLNLKKKTLAAFGILFFIITFSPLSNVLIKIGTSYGDRMVYIPSMGFLLALVFFVFKIFKIPLKNTSEKVLPLLQQYRLPMLLLGLITFLYGFKTIDRNQDWKSSFTLYEADVKVAPNSAKLRYHYSLELSKKGLDATDPTVKRQWFDRANEQLQKAVSIYPAYHDAYAQLGLYHYRIKQPDKAIEMYQKAIEHKPNSPKAYSNMGIIYFERGQIEKAQEVYEKAVRLDPRFVDARRNLGSVYARKGLFEQAIEQFSAALRYAPDDAVVNFYLGSAYRDAGRAAEGKPYMDKACRLNSDYCKN